jgi:hypothetical protein
LALRTDTPAHHRLVLVVGGVGMRQSPGFWYCVAFVVLGTLAWGAGTVWYTRRRAQWPSPFSRRLLEPVLGKHSPLEEGELRTVVLTNRHHR